MNISYRTAAFIKLAIILFLLCLMALIANSQTLEIYTERGPSIYKWTAKPSKPKGEPIVEIFTDHGIVRKEKQQKILVP